MKKIILSIAMIAGLMTATFAGPNENGRSAAAEKNISASIRSQIALPEVLTEKEGEFFATITFRVTDCGAMMVKDIECADRDLKASLMDQSSGLRVNTEGLNTKDTYKVVVRFSVL